MRTVMSLGACLLAGATLMAPATAQEEPPKQKANTNRPVKARAIKPMRAMRLVGGGARKAPTQAELQDRFEKKMAESWVKNASWVTDYDEARKQAAESGKKIVAYFTRSYAP